jgi:hypothetical protein
MGKVFGILNAMDNFERAVCCDWCGMRTASLSERPTIDGSHGDGRGYHLLCRKCVTRYNQEGGKLDGTRNR